MKHEELNSEIIRKSLPSQEGSGLKHDEVAGLYERESLPSQEGSGLKLRLGFLGSVDDMSSLARGKWIEALLSRKKAPSVIFVFPRKREVD